MYRKAMYGQQKLEIPFGVELNVDNRWVKLSGIMPWDEIEENYAQNFDGTNGHEAKPSRLAFGALYIQNRLAITDEETVEQIRETPSMQYFCGFESYTTAKPFDSSLMVHFRKRITPEMMKEIAEKAFAAEARKTIEAEKPDNSDDNGNNDVSNDNNVDKSNNNADNNPKGTLLLDATCCPADIHYPTDIGLLNHARELLECVIDDLHA